MISWLKFLAKKPYSEIDERIKNLVDTMNATGVITTVASCQGHFGGFVRKPPYVYFKAPVAVAALIEQQLREAAMFDDKRLKAFWLIKGVFDDNYCLTFLLYSPKYEQELTSLVRDAWDCLLNRKNLDADLLNLAAIVEQTLLLNFGDKHEPRISKNYKHRYKCK
ncbi:MAG: hypothetical protein Q7U37_09975 [Gallionella sp.]|nr:hypothetical protein [Gallionella sp.]